MYIKGLVSVVLIAFLVTSCNFDECSSKRFYLASYDQFMKKIEKKQDDFTKEEWSKNDEKFEQFSGECFDKFSDDLTSKEKKKVMRHSFKYVVYRVQSELPFDLTGKDEEKVNEFLDEIDWDEFKDKGDEIKEMWKELDKSKFNDAAEKFGKAFEKLGEGLEELGKELEEVFEETAKELEEK